MVTYREAVRANPGRGGRGDLGRWRGVSKGDLTRVTYGWVFSSVGPHKHHATHSLWRLVEAAPAPFGTMPAHLVKPTPRV